MFGSFSSLDKTKEHLNEFLSKDRSKVFIVVLAFTGIFMIFLSNFSSRQKSSTVKSLDSKVNSQQYSEQLSHSLENILSNINGAGDSKVLVTLENGAETVYAAEEKKNKEASEDKENGETTRRKESDDCEKKYITVRDSEGTEHALAITEIEPKIKGVIVVCPGGEEPVVQQRITNAVTTALSIPSNKVCVTKSCN